MVPTVSSTTTGDFRSPRIWQSHSPQWARAGAALQPLGSERALAPSMFLQIYHLCKAKGIWLIRHPSKIHLLKALMVILRYLQDWSMHYGTGWAHTAKISHRSCIYLGPWTWVPEGNGLQGTGLPFQLCLEKTRQLHFQHCMADTCRICSSPFTEYAALRLFSKL